MPALKEICPVYPSHHQPCFPVTSLSSSRSRPNPLPLVLNAASRLLTLCNFFFSLAVVLATGCERDDLLSLLNCVDAPSDEGGDLLWFAAASFSSLRTWKKLETRR